VGGDVLEPGLGECLAQRPGGQLGRAADTAKQQDEGGPGTGCRHGGVLPERAGRLHDLVVVRVGRLPAGRFPPARSRLVPRGTAAHGYGCKCEGHGGVAPSPTSPGLQPPAGFAAVSPGVPPLLTWTRRRLLLTLSPFPNRRTAGGGGLR